MIREVATIAALQTSDFCPLRISLFALLLSQHSLARLEREALLIPHAEHVLRISDAFDQTLAGIDATR